MLRRALLTLAVALALAVMGAVLAFGPGRLLAAGQLVGHVVTALQDPRSLAPDPQRLVYDGAETERERVADLYRPPGDARAEAALVLVPGATPLGLEDPALRGFAGALARSGFRVLVPRLAGDDPVRVSAADQGPIADALAHLTERAAVETAGLAAISYAAGPAFLAALEAESRSRIAFLAAIGGYYDITAAVTYLTTGKYRDGPDSPWKDGPVEARAKWRFLQANADRVDPADAAVLDRIARRKLANLDADVGALVARLGADGRAAWRLLSNCDPARVPGLIAALPAELKNAIAALDLSARDLSRLDVPVLLIHGRDDPMIPHPQSRALARALPDGRAHLAIVDSLFHVRLEALGPLEALALYDVAYRFIAVRDRAPVPERMHDEATNGSNRLGRHPDEGQGP